MSRRRRDDEPQALRGLTDAEKVEHLLDTVRVLTALPDDDTRLMLRLGLTRQEARILGALTARGGNHTTREQLRTALYWDRHPDEEPETDVMGVVICRLRRKLARHGVPFEIKNYCKTGGYSGHWLEVAE